MLSPKPWRAEVVMLLLASIFICFLAGTLLSGVLQHLHAPGFQHDDDLGVIMLATLSLDGPAWVFGWFFLRLHEVGVGELLGWKKGKWGRLLALVAGTLVVILPVALALQMLSGAALQRLGYFPKEQEAVALFANAHSAATLAYLIFFATVLAPTAEEFVFRGVLYPYIKQLGYPVWALIVVSFLFALVHGSVVVIVPLFVFALAQTWLYEKTDCLLAPILTHAMFNLSNLMIMFLSGTISPASVYRP